jgi:hypothetical protein
MPAYRSLTREEGEPWIAARAFLDQADLTNGRLRTTAVRGRRRVQYIGPNGEAIKTVWLEQMTPAALNNFLGYDSYQQRKHRWGW